MIPAKEFEQELKTKLYEAWLGHPNHTNLIGSEREDIDRRSLDIVTNMDANSILWDLQFPEVRQYLRYILARSDIDWTYVDNSTED
jgi:hypothetical protein